ncbi:ATP synthase subunit delta [Spirilliplanes yamanashiensis]|uniref:ATP synthase subunit delta n=2 Tax=Spirilliplanes yamanashiensis TaxID=42233 RepID=A0A8J3Y484_9ACTN|nr:F-type H+-transporting ATPase subunit delta [Spirilliplanes yamanashiensis]GIJ01265.1 ATP synthase subunit delta [Spirilliplanes yamanashiensis]
MSAATREAYAEATGKLAAYGKQATAENVAAVADEVLAVARLLGREPRLRRALTDPSRSGKQRAELLGSLLSGKVGVVTVELVGALVAGRWSAPSELLTATERLAVDALLLSADRAGELSEVEDELFRFGQLVSATPALAAVLADVSATQERRVTLVRDLLKGKVRLATGKLVEVALAGFGGRGFEVSLTRMVELAAAKRDREVAYVTVARPLAETDEQRLAAKLSELYGRQVSLKIDVDPNIIGGISVRVGSDLYDGTILRRLTEARQAFAK